MIALLPMTGGPPHGLCTPALTWTTSLGPTSLLDVLECLPGPHRSLSDLKGLPRSLPDLEGVPGSPLLTP